MAYDLTALSTSELMASAAKVRDSNRGRYLTFSPKVFIPLTRLCNDACGYCTFVRRPSQVKTPFLSMEDVRAIAEAGVAANCHEALFTLGERPENRWSEARTWLEENGHPSTVDYLASVAGRTMAEFGLLPHLNAGALTPEELAVLRPASVSQGMMLESIRPDLEAHRAAPDKAPARRLATIKAAGELAIPFTTGLLVGIGDSEADRVKALLELAALAEEYGHIQEVIIQNFLPKPRTRLAGAPPADTETFLRTIALARLILPPGVHLQAPPNLSDDVSGLVAAGIDDLGGISPVTIDHVNPERPWPHLDKLARQVEELGFNLVPRLAIYPEFASEPGRWLAEPARFPVLDHADASGYAREDRWVSGGEEPSPSLFEERPLATNLAVFRPRSDSGSGPLAELLEAVDAGHEPDSAEIEMLFSARGNDVRRVAEVADGLRERIVGDDVTFIVNRNINYTNICTFRCRFCAFSKGPLSLNLRGAPYTLSMDELAQRVTDAAGAGATEVCLQGGIHPDFDAEYYLDVVRTVKAAVPEMHVHAFSALEVHEGARRAGLDLEEYLGLLKEAGLRTLPGTAAEILDDEVREILCPDKIRTETWLEVHRAAHAVGLNSNVTIMFGSIERPASWAKHLSRTRELQKKTGGFTEFVPLPFVHMATPIYMRKLARRGPTFREAVLMHAVGRIAYASTIPNIQASWVKMGVSGAQELLRSGANDLGGTLMEENISRAAGASHGQALEADDFLSITAPLGRRLVQRSTLYGHLRSFDGQSRDAG